MVISILDLSKAFNSTNKGVFNSSVETNNNAVEKNNSLLGALNTEKITMDINSIDKLRALIQSQFNNDIDCFAESIGKSVKEIMDMLNGNSEIPPNLFDDAKNSFVRSGDNIQFGDTIKYIEINNSGSGYINNYDGMMKGSQSDIIKKQKTEIAALHKILKDKDELLAAKEEVIGMLKEQLNNYEKMNK